MKYVAVGRVESYIRFVEIDEEQCNNKLGTIFDSEGWLFEFNDLKTELQNYGAVRIRDGITGINKRYANIDYDVYYPYIKYADEYPLVAVYIINKTDENGKEYEYGFQMVDVNGALFNLSFQEAYEASKGRGIANVRFWGKEDENGNNVYSEHNVLDGILESKNIADLGVVKFDEKRLRNEVTKCKMFGLDYEVDFHTATLVKYKGTAKSIVIPSQIRYIADNAFMKEKINELILNEGLEDIGDFAFAFNHIEKLVIPKSVKRIGEEAFSANKIKELILNDGLEYIEINAFCHNKIERLEVPKSVKIIGEFAFLGNEIKELILNKGLEYIGKFAFIDNLKNIFK